MPDSLHFTEDADANRFLAEEPLALLIGMLLDQQFPMERAFLSRYLLRERLGRDLDATHIAAMDEDDLAAVFSERPALHRFPGSMGKRTHAVCQYLVEHYDGHAEALWTGADSGKGLYRRLRELPGFGEAKARVFVGLLGKRLGVQPDGWEEVAADWPSIADVASFDDVAILRQQKKDMKAAKKATKA